MRLEAPGIPTFSSISRACFLAEFRRGLRRPCETRSQFTTRGALALLEAASRARSDTLGVTARACSRPGVMSFDCHGSVRARGTCAGMLTATWRGSRVPASVVFLLLTLGQAGASTYYVRVQAAEGQTLNIAEVPGPPERV